MHSMQVGMSLQSWIAFVQLPLSKLGHCTMSQPMVASDGSLPSGSGVPQVLSLPAQLFTIVRLSLVLAFMIAGTVLRGSSLQTVARGSLALSFASSHLWSALAFACTKPAAALMMAALHLMASFTASARALVPSARTEAAVASSAMRFRATRRESI